MSRQEPGLLPVELSESACACIRACRHRAADGRDDIPHAGLAGRARKTLTWLPRRPRVSVAAERNPR
ncbi:MAG: hypothetical protein JWN20_1795 [Jatrophihabitantaceae bacterium]|nr:hypothetical protein [Jatrophihabitantaceae bacterium]